MVIWSQAFGYTFNIFFCLIPIILAIERIFCAYVTVQVYHFTEQWVASEIFDESLFHVLNQLHK